MKKLMRYIKGEGPLARILRATARDIGLSEQEFLCFCDANNGIQLDIFDVEGGFGMNVADSGPNGLAEKWNVDLKALSEKLDGLTTLQKCALVEASAGFFSRETRMKTIEETASAGNENGHVPGNVYRDVDATIKRVSSGRWQVEILETRGNWEQEYGRKTIFAQGLSLDEAVQKAGEKAKAAAINQEYLAQALSCAEAQAAEAAERGSDDKDLSQVTTERLLAELGSRGIKAA